MTAENPRLERLKQSTQTRMQKEQDDLIGEIHSRADYLPSLAPFIETLAQAQSPSAFLRNAEKKVMTTLCIQAPLELFHAGGIQPFRLACGSHVSCHMAPLHLPALTCPMIKSLSGLLRLEASAPDWVIPTTCDWVTKFSELTGLCDTANIHFMELPRLRENERSSKRWLNEIKIFKTWLENRTGRRITPKTLLHSVRLYARAFALYSRLIDLRRRQVIPALHFALIINAMPYQDINAWMTAVAAYILDLREPEQRSVPVFLTGSPIAFPNYKMLFLIENAGMAVVADDLCTMERTFPGPAVYRDKSEYGLLNALAQRHHKACTCPTFADNQRRLNSLTGILKQHGINGVIFHVLKGCHPYDMESGILENQLKEKGIRFLKIETDYVEEDRENIVTRLEAFKRTLRR